MKIVCPIKFPSTLLGVFLLPALNWAQPEFRSTVLGDGVQRWHRVRPANALPSFFSTSKANSTWQ
jgi:hypothetical protein